MQVLEYRCYITMTSSTIVPSVGEFSLRQQIKRGNHIGELSLLHMSGTDSYSGC